MLSKEVLKYIAYIEIQTRRLLNSTMAGDSRSAVRGTGFEFDQIRDYQLGDDIRCIDWRGSARMQKLLTKEYIEERNRTIIIAVDVSASTAYSSGQLPKYWHMSQVAAVLAVVAQYGKDKVGLVLFTDSVEVYIPPRAGKEHTYNVLARIFSHAPQSKGTNFTCVANHLINIGQKNAVVFLISDFIAAVDQVKWAALKKMYDLVAIRSIDQLESDVPALGFLSLCDVESGVQVTIDARHACASRLNGYLNDRLNQQTLLFKRTGVDLLDIRNNELFMGQLVRFFRRRMTY